jgi:hypothetical protein
VETNILYTPYLSEQKRTKQLCLKCTFRGLWCYWLTVQCSSVNYLIRSLWLPAPICDCCSRWQSDVDWLPHVATNVFLVCLMEWYILFKTADGVTFSRLRLAQTTADNEKSPPTIIIAKSWPHDLNYLGNFSNFPLYEHPSPRAHVKTAPPRATDRPRASERALDAYDANICVCQVYRLRQSLQGVSVARRRFERKRERENRKSVAFSELRRLKNNEFEGLDMKAICAVSEQCIC